MKIYAEKKIDEDFQFFKKGLNLSYRFEELNEDVMSQLIDSKLDVIDPKSEDSITAYLYAVEMLKWWLEITNSTKSWKEIFNEYTIDKYKTT